MSEKTSNWSFPLLGVLVFAAILWIGFYLSPYNGRRKWFMSNDDEDATQNQKTPTEISLYQDGCVVKPTNHTPEAKLSNFIELFPGTLVYSAFYDNTKPEIPYFRLMVISETFRPLPLLCHSRCDSKFEVAKYYLPKEHKKRRHAAFIVSCSAPRGLESNPGFVDISAELDGKKSKIVRLNVRSTKKRKTFQNLTICVPPIYKGDGPSKSNVAEFIELNKILGANHFIFYDIEINSKAREVLKYYEEKGIVTVLPWRMPFYLKDFYSIHYHGQVLSIQDCLYRSRGSSKFVAFHDLDEFIVPTKKRTFTEILNSIDKEETSGYRIRSVVFPTQVVDPEGTSSKLVTQRHFKRTASYMDTRSKCAVNPGKVFSMDIHGIGLPSDPKYKKDWIISEASVYHYRQCAKYEDLEHACKTLITEYRMKMYKEELEREVGRVLGSV